VIPEIEMPGHSIAAIAAYPWLSCFPSKPTHIPPNMISRKSVEEQQNGRIKLVQETWGVFDDVFCAGKDSTFSFLQQVIDEVVPLFPSKYFHIGGDESPKTHWKQCPNCQQRIRDLKLKDEHELQSYFVQRMEKYLNSKGKILIGWDEILEGGLAPNAIVMSWRGETGGIEAARQQHQVIMTPGNPVYFDHTQSQQEDSVTIGGYNPLDKVYAYEPIPAALNVNEARFVLGAQANLWTEYIKNPRKVEYMIFPRMSALSEVLWSPKQNRNWEHFQQRLPGIMERYKKWNANYSKTYYDIQSSIIASPDNKGVLLKLETRKPGDTLFIYREAWVESHPVYDQKMNVTGFISNGMGIPWMAYSEPVQITEPGNYGVAYTSTINRANNLPYPGFGLMVQIKFNKATGKQISLQQQASAKYPGNGAFTLVDGILNDKGLARSREFLGFEGTDCIATIDLGDETTINQVVIHHLEQQGSWIYSPSAIDVAGSADGINFQSLGSNVVMTKAALKDKTTLQFDAPVRTRYLRVSIFNHGVIATGNPGAGNKAWLFVDEIEVN
jgi:hexosaminidase